MQLTPEQQAAIDEQKQYCPFCKIVKGEIPAQKVYEDGEFLAILDINPGSQGHTLLLPKEHHPILAFVPDKTQASLAKLIPQISQALQKSMMATQTELFIANGPAAGQQASHFLVHLIPVDKPLFKVPDVQNPNATRVKEALARQFTNPRDRLVQIIMQNPELKRMLIEQPDEFIKNLPAAPDLAKMFAGVDIKALSKQLATNEHSEATAIKMEDKALVQFIDSKEKLRELLTTDLQTLEMAIETQPKLKTFFEGTTAAAVLARYTKAKSANASPGGKA